MSQSEFIYRCFSGTGLDLYGITLPDEAKTFCGNSGCDGDLAYSTRTVERKVGQKYFQGRKPFPENNTVYGIGGESPFRTYPTASIGNSVWDEDWLIPQEKKAESGTKLFSRGRRNSQKQSRIYIASAFIPI